MVGMETEAHHSKTMMESHFNYYHFYPCNLLNIKAMSQTGLPWRLRKLIIWIQLLPNCHLSIMFKRIISYEIFLAKKI